MISGIDTVESPVSLLPTEILSLVFQYSCPPPDFNLHYGGLDPWVSWKGTPERRAQFALCAVSTRWREVALATPQLWAFVDISVETFTIHRACEILRLFVVRSGTLFMAVGLDVADGLGARGTTIWSVIRETRHRIRELYLYRPPESWLNDIKLFTSFVHLSIDYPSWQAGRENLSIDVPCSRLALRDIMEPFSISLCWTFVTVLQLYNMNVDFCLGLLAKCTHLIEFRNIAPRPNTTHRLEPLPLPTSPFTLQYLETFEWSWNIRTGPMDEVMLRNIHMPALRTLYWPEDIFREIHDPSDPRVGFFARVPPTLTTLYLDADQLRAVFYLEDSSASTPSFPHIVNMEPHIEYVRLRNCYDGSLNRLFHFFSENHRRDRKPKFASLKDISIQVGGANLSLVQLDFNGFLRMLEVRLEGQSLGYPRLHLKFHISTGNVNWPLNFKEKVKDLVGRGLELQIVEGSKAITWD